MNVLYKNFASNEFACIMHLTTMRKYCRNLPTLKPHQIELRYKTCHSSNRELAYLVLPEKHFLSNDFKICARAVLDLYGFVFNKQDCFVCTKWANTHPYNPVAKFTYIEANHLASFSRA